MHPQGTFMDMTRLGTLLTCGALASAGLLAGCGGDEATTTGTTTASKPADPTTAFTAASKKTQAAKSYKLHATTKLDSQGKPVEFSFDGVTDVQGKKASLDLDLAAVAKDAGASLDSLGGADALKGKIITDGSGGSFKLYAKVPALNKAFEGMGATNLPDYGVVDLGSLPKLAGVDLGVLVKNSQSADQSAALLQALSGKPEAVGTEEVRGVKTTHYKATIDYTKRVPDASPELKDTIAQLATLMRKTGMSTKLPVEAWIDDQGLLRKESIVQELPDGAGKTTTSFELFDYDEPVTVDVPAADQTWDVLAELKKRMPSALEGLNG